METTDAEVVEVETAVEALDHMQRCGHLVDVVFCDFRSDRGGRDLAREMRMRWPGVSRILLSITDPVEASPLPPDVMTLAKDWRALDLLKAADVYGHA